MSITRRSLIGALGALGCCAAFGAEPARVPRRPLIDAHVHLFGSGDSRSGCFVSERQRNHWNYPFFLKLLNLREGTLDEDYVASLVGQLRTSSIDRAVLFAQDGRYDSNGELDRGETNVFVPNEYLFNVVDRYPDLFIACCSINPKRRDATDELERCAERGVRALKIHPPIQDVDPALPRIMQEPSVLARLLHGSDWPFTSNPVVFWNRLALWEVARLSAETNLFERDRRLKRQLGLPAAVFERAASLYPR